MTVPASKNPVSKAIQRLGAAGLSAALALLAPAGALAQEREGPIFQTGASPAMELTAWKEKLREEVVSHWTPPKLGLPGMVCVRCTINRMGTVLNLQIMKSSGDNKMDQSVLRAVQLSVPPAIPESGGDAQEADLCLEYPIRAKGVPSNSSTQAEREMTAKTVKFGLDYARRAVGVDPEYTPMVKQMTKGVAKYVAENVDGHQIVNNMVDNVQAAIQSNPSLNAISQAIQGKPLAIGPMPGINPELINNVQKMVTAPFEQGQNVFAQGQSANQVQDLIARNVMPSQNPMANGGSGIGFVRDPSGMTKEQLNAVAAQDLSQGQFGSAIGLLTEALRKDPNYREARENLAISYNNYGLALAGEPDRALKLFRHALFHKPGDATVQANMKMIMTNLGRNWLSFDDHMALGDAAFAEQDFIGAFVEYQQANQIKPDQVAQQKLVMAQQRIKGF